MTNKLEYYVVVKRKPRKTRAVHSGTWKVAFADFAVAMMAFFLLMWILNRATAPEIKAISEYFIHPAAHSQSVAQEITITATIPKTKAEKLAAQELDKLTQLKQLLENKIEQTEPLKNYKDQIYLDISNEGLRIQIFDNDKRAMFPRSSARMNGYAVALLANLVPVINQVDNRISITGHTDAMPFQKSDEYTNWELSTDRANAARYALIAGGLAENKIARIVGLASTILFDADDPGNANNRRISIIILRKEVDSQMQQQETKLNGEIKTNMESK